jgi:hypothetical protein
MLLFLGCASDSAADAATSVDGLCNDPAGHVGERVRVQVDLTPKQVSQTLVRCSSADGGPGAACCNVATVKFSLPCGAQGRRIYLRPSAGLQLAPTGYGPYTPAVFSAGRDPDTVTLGCIGCEVGLSCSPADPAAVRAVWGSIQQSDLGSDDFTFVVDTLE